MAVATEELEIRRPLGLGIIAVRGRPECTFPRSCAFALIMQPCSNGKRVPVHAGKANSVGYLPRLPLGPALMLGQKLRMDRQRTGILRRPGFDFDPLGICLVPGSRKLKDVNFLRPILAV